MKPNSGKRIVTVISLLVLVMTLLPGCKTNETNEPITPPSSSHIPPTQPISAEMSFPNGAPALNKTAILRCAIYNRLELRIDASVNIELPSGFELVSGQLSWTGAIPEQNHLDVINAEVKSIAEGNWTINGKYSITPIPRSGIGGDGYIKIYVSVSDNVAKWGIYPPWSDVPPTVPPTTSSSG